MTTDTTMTAEDPWADEPVSAPQTEQAPQEPAAPASPGEAPPAAGSGHLELVPSLDLLTLNDPHAVAALTKGLTEELIARIDAIADDSREHRPAGKPSASLLGPELRALAVASDVLANVAKALHAGRHQAAYRATESMLEVMGEGRRSVKVPDGHGSEITASLTPRMETSADEQEILDVLGTMLVANAQGEQHLDERAYALGVRHGLAELRKHLPATIPWKTTALTATAKALGSVGEDALAARLDTAWARVEVGEPTAKLDVKAPRA